jgi:hypothetical protein
MNTRTARSAAICALVSGCSWNPLASSYAPPPACVETATEVAPDDASLGFSAEDLYAIVVGAHTATFRYFHDPAEPGLTLVVDRSTAPVRLLTFAEPSGRVCRDPSLRFSAAVSLVTSDGAIDESWEQEVDLTQWSPMLGLGLVRDTSELRGTLDLGAMDRMAVWGAVYAEDDGTVRMHGNVDGQQFAGSDTGNELVAGLCVGRWNLPDDPPCEE